MIQFNIETQKHAEFISINHLIQGIIADNDWQEGVLTLYVPHTTAGVTIQENADPDVVKDMIYALDKVFPWNDPNYRHGEGNSAAHLKAATMGTSTQVIVHKSSLLMGTWQGIYFCEFDGPRNRTVWIDFTPKPKA